MDVPSSYFCFLLGISKKKTKEEIKLDEGFGAILIV